MKKVFIVLLVTLAIDFLGGCSDDAGGGESSSSKVAAPTGLKASAKSSTSIRLTWASVDGASCYNIEYNDGYGWTSEGTSPSHNEHTVSGLQPYTSYSFRVRAVGRSGTSEWSSTKSARTKIGAPSVMATKSGTTVSLTVGKVKGADTYSISYGTSNDYNLATYYGIADIEYEEGDYFITKVKGLASGKSYYFFVTAHALNTNGDGATGMSNRLTF